MTDLEPGGVYTFWWVVPQGEAIFPDDIFMAGKRPHVGVARASGHRGVPRDR